MIHCLTSSYWKDFERASSLNWRLLSGGAVHHIFVEQGDYELFRPLVHRGNTLIHIKPDGGEGGLGRAGTMARFPCYKIMQRFIKEGDSYVQLDSDVIIDPEIIPELACSPIEVKGFFDPDRPVHLERDASNKPTDVRFTHLSGMSICAGWHAFQKSIPQSEAEMLSIIDFMLAEGFVPSEDVVLSCLLQRSDFELTNLFASYDRTFNSRGDVKVSRKKMDFGRTLFDES
jgi:hypothetical protein